MRRISSRLVAIAVTATLVALGVQAFPSAASAATTTRLMVVGDSISQGSAGDYTWRYRLAKHLSAVGASVDFVGPRSDLFDNVTNVQGSTAYADPNFDRDHDATWGQPIIYEKDTIQSEVAAATPDVILVLLGTNDLYFFTGPQDTETNLEALIANARAAKPNVKIVLGTVIPRASDPNNLDFQTTIDSYNALLKFVAPTLSTPTSPVVVADTATGYDPSTDSWDGTHPNANGEVKIAAAFADTLSSSLAIGSPYPRPIAALPVGPRTAPVLSVVAGDGQAPLSWTLSPGATGYWVWMRNVTNGESFGRLPYPMFGTSTSWTAGALVNGATYEFKLQASKGSADGVFSNVVSVRPVGPAPAAPTGFTVTAGNGQATLAWNASANATGYYVLMRSVTNGETTFTQLPYPLGASPWVAAGLVNGATYEFKLLPINGLINGTATAAVSVKPTGPTPTGPTAFTAKAGDSQAVLSWTAAANATGYYVWMRNVTAGQAFGQLPYPIGGTSWTAGGLVNGATYEFKLQSLNGIIAGGFSTVASVKPSGVAPSAASGLTAAVGNGQSVLKWTAGANATGYYVWMRNVTAGETSFTQLPYPVSGTTWTAGALVNGAKYEFKLQSLNGIVAGPYSNVAAVTPTAPAPAAATGLTATAGFGQATLNWTNTSTATGYYVWLRDVTTAQAFYKLPYAIAGPSWVAAGLVPGHKYEFKLQSVNGLVTGAYTAVASATLAAIPTVTGITAVAPVGTHNTLKVSWSAVSGADEYWVYSGTKVTANLCDFSGASLVQYGVTSTNWTQTLLPEGTTCYWVAAVKNGTRGPTGLGNFGLPTVESTQYLAASSNYFGTVPAGAVRYRTTVAAGTDAGIVVARAYIQDAWVPAVPGYSVMGDNRLHSFAPYAGSRVTIAWNTGTGAVSVTTYPSCLKQLGDGYVGCADARPYVVNSGAFLATDVVHGTIPANQFSVKLLGTDRLQVAMGAYNSVLIPENSVYNTAAPAINSEITLTSATTNHPAAVTLRGDRFPSYEFVQFNRWVSISIAQGTTELGYADQNHFWDLFGGWPGISQHTCSGSGATTGPLACVDGA